jgi:hypothetical protein
VPIVVTANKFGNQLYVVTLGQKNLEVYAKNGAVWSKLKTYNTDNALVYSVTDDLNGRLYFIDTLNNLWAINSGNGATFSGFPVAISGKVVQAQYLADVDTNVTGDELILPLNNGQRAVVSSAGVVLNSQIEKKSFLDLNSDSNQPFGIFSALNSGNFTFNNNGWQKKTTAYAKIKLEPVTVGSNVVLPGVVQGLKANSGRGKIVLNWTEYTGLGADHFNLYRANSTAQGITELTPLTTLNTSSTSYEDVDVALNTDYYYALAVVDNKGTVGLSTDWVGPVQAKQVIANNYNFKFEEADTTNGFVDSVSGLVMHCNATNCPDVGVTGIAGSAVQFNGIDDYAYINNVDFVAPSDQLTLEAWVKPEANLNSTTTLYQTIIGKGLNFNLNISDAGLLSGSIRNQSNQRVVIEAANVVRMSEWNYIALTYDGSLIKIYVNGVKVGEKAQTGLISQTTEVVSVGNLNGRYNPLQGILDEIKIYQQVLSAEELKANYDQYTFTPPVNNTTNLHFDFSEPVNANAFFDVTKVMSAQCQNGSCPIAGVSGISGNAVQFNGLGKNYLYLYDSQYTRPTNELTLEAWVKPEQNLFSTTTPYQTVISKSTIFELSLSDTGAVRGGITNSDGVRVAFDAANAILMGQWNHIAMTYNGSVIKLYANGIKVGEKAQTGLVMDSNTLVYFGRLGIYLPYQGLLDEAKIYTRALTDAEINTDYNQYPQNFVGPDYLQFNFSEGANALSFADLSGTKFSQCSGTTCPTSGVVGISGNGLSFDGLDDVALVLDSTYTKPTDQLTLEAWVNPQPNLNSTSSYQAVLAKAQDYTMLISDTGLLQLSIKNQSNTRVILSVPYVIKYGEWNHLVMTYDGALIKAYVNGVKVGEKVQTGLVADSGGNLYIGNYNKITALQGMLDEVRVYKRVLSVVEIQSNYNAYTNVNTPLPLSQQSLLLEVPTTTIPVVEIKLPTVDDKITTSTVIIMPTSTIDNTTSSLVTDYTISLPAVTTSTDPVVVVPITTDTSTTTTELPVTTVPSTETIATSTESNSVLVSQ